MKRLTEEMVIARTKISDLSTIKRLNCWGSELTDVSLLRRMSNVEVLALSINKISSLADFQSCRNLQELYIRQNSIKDLNEVCYLQNLPNLKNLWLGENPCAEGDGYRLTVLRALPRLQKLDDVAVSPEEMSEASKRGKILIHPEDEDASTGQQGETWNSRSHSQRTSPEISPTRCEESPPRRYEPEQKQNYSPDPDTGPAYYEDRRNANNYEQESPRQSRHYQYDDYTNGDRYHTTQYQQSSAYRQNEGSDGSNYSHSGYEQPHPPRQRDPRERSERCERPACPSNHRPPFHRRPVTRNSNILSAVLCLVKELDYPSLEVVEMAVRCRMDELED